jgi:hypothetical protein
MHRLVSIVAGIVCAASIVAHAQAGLTGKWQGETGTGRPLLLDATIKGKALTGTLTVGPQTAELTDGKADEKTFSFTIAIEGRTAACSGRLIEADVVELTVQDVRDPVTLRRVKKTP